jgi:hypothetical protein
VPPKNQYIAPQEVEAAIQESGYLLERRAAQVLEENKFEVFPNWLFPVPGDPGKMNEVDVLARTFEWISGETWSRASAIAFVECKNNSQPVAFFLSPQKSPDANDARILYAGFPQDAIPPDDEELRKLLKMKDWHHYCETKEVATQFCGFKNKKENDKNKKGNKWKAEPMANYTQSFSALCLAAISRSSLFPTDEQNIELEFYYPIVVFQGPIYAVHVDGANLRTESVGHVQLHHGASVYAKPIKAQVDVVTESEFPTLLQTILKELKRIQEGLQEHYERLLATSIAQKRLVKHAEIRARFSRAAG